MITSLFLTDDNVPFVTGFKVIHNHVTHFK